MFYEFGSFVSYSFKIRSTWLTLLYNDNGDGEGVGNDWGWPVLLLIYYMLVLNLK